MNRKDFIRTTGLGLAATSFTAAFGSFPNDDAPEPIKPEIVKEFVGAGHSNYEKVKTLLEEFPNLLFARHDWGNGDFESGLEAAGHVGNKEIAEFLIKKGARINLFVLTMLGKPQLVLPVLEEYPEMVFSKGPHGFTLLHHAILGGENAKPILDYVTKKGLKERKIPIK